MVDPTSAIHSPVFSGPPVLLLSARPENPMIHDPLFGEALPTPVGCFPLAAAYLHKPDTEAGSPSQRVLR
ncbi:hypothetical protein ABZP36_015095 [Zizania latifolia]